MSVFDANAHPEAIWTEEPDPEAIVLWRGLHGSISDDELAAWLSDEVPPSA